MLNIDYIGPPPHFDLNNLISDVFCSDLCSAPHNNFFVHLRFASSPNFGGWENLVEK